MKDKQIYAYGFFIIACCFLLTGLLWVDFNKQIDALPHKYCHVNYEVLNNSNFKISNDVMMMTHIEINNNKTYEINCMRGDCTISEIKEVCEIK